MRSTSLRFPWFVIGLGLVLILPCRAGAREVILESRPSPERGLSGKRVILDASHGLTWNEERLWWGWQRTAIHEGEREDLITPRIVNRWLVPYFQNAGAVVVTTRERDEQVHEVRIDDADTSGNFATTGDWTSEPFPGAKGGTALTASTTPGPDGPTATWYADLPATATYGLCIWFPSIDTPTTATYQIHTAAGDVRLQLNQRTDTARWYWIDWFVFPAGRHPILTLTTQSNEVGTQVVADAVRLGGGMGDTDWGGGVSGVPRWQEYCKSFAKFYGAPSYVWDQYVTASDFGIRRNFGSWMGGDFMLELHTNADGSGSGTQSGTLTYWFVGRNEAEADVFRWIHDHIVESIRGRWLPGWVDQGISPDNQYIYPWYSYPAELIELAYHDRLEPDLLSLVDPDFRSIAARAIYEGIATMIEGENVVYLPEPPKAPAVFNEGGGRVRVQWRPPSWGPAPDRYRVYVSHDALAYDLGRDVGNVTETVLDGYAPGDVFYVRVVAENEGGRSFPTETLGVRVGDSPSLLIVNGFDRLDRVVQEPDNPRRFVREHIDAFATADDTIAIDSISNEALVLGDASLADYPVVDWTLGLESTDDNTFSTEEQTLVTAYLDAGGRLLATGTDIGLDLVGEGTSADREFAADVFHMGFVEHGSRVRTAVGSAGGPFAEWSLDLGTPETAPYDVGTPDILEAGLGGQAILTWGENGGAAGIAYAGGPGKALVLATPLEAIVGASVRAQLARRAYEFLQAPPEPDTQPPQIFSVRVTELGSDRATVRWRTDEPAVGYIQWGTDDTYGSQTLTQSEFASDHAVTLLGLMPETEYHYRIFAQDYRSNEVWSGDFRFATPPPDLAPPVITDFMVIAVSDRDVVLFWMTDEPATSQAEWGTDTNYGNLSTPDESLRIAHFHAVTGLSSSSSIHVRPVSRDLSGNEARGDDIVLQTLDPIGDVIVDDSDPEFLSTGEWTIGTYSLGFSYNNSYIFTHIQLVDEDPKEAIWPAQLPLPGMWQSLCWYTSGGNRAVDAPYTIVYTGGEETVLVNQTAGGARFNAIGSPHFYETSAAELRLSNTARTNDVVIADAARWTFVGLGDGDNWRFVTPRELLEHILGLQPIEPAVTDKADPNGDGVADVADLLHMRLPAP